MRYGVRAHRFLRLMTEILSEQDPVTLYTKVEVRTLLTHFYA